jgi:hypothetical protein
MTCEQIGCACEFWRIFSLGWLGGGIASALVVAFMLREK